MRVGNEYKDRKLKKTVSKNVRLTVKDATEFEKYAKRRGIPFTGPGVKFCVSVFRQSQEWHWKAGRILA